MNKKTKGIIAGIAGGAILLGSAGTFALWSDEATISGGATVSGGAFALSDGEIAWTVTDGINTTDRTDSAFTLVPGVTLIGTVDSAIELDGDYLKATLTVTATGDDVPTWLDVTWEVNDAPLGAGSQTVAPADLVDGGDLTVSIKLSDQAEYGGESTVADQIAWSVPSFTVTLEQIVPSVV